VGSGGVLYSQAGVGGEAATGGAASSVTSSAGTDNRLPRPSKRPADFYDNVFNVSTLTFTPCRGGLGPITVAERSKAWTVFAHSEAEILHSDPTQGMDIWCVCVYIYAYSVFLLFCV
jgi:hypothetical protein